MAKYGFAWKRGREVKPKRESLFAGSTDSGKRPYKRRWTTNYIVMHIVMQGANFIGITTIVVEVRN